MSKFKPAPWPRKLRSQEWFAGTSKDAIYHRSWMKNQGLPADLSLQLARATVAGAGALAMADDTPPAALREAVTSPNGTTAAGLVVLMDADTGLPPLIARTVTAAAERSRELGK